MRWPWPALALVMDLEMGKPLTLEQLFPQISGLPKPIRHEPSRQQPQQYGGHQSPNQQMSTVYRHRP